MKRRIAVRSDDIRVVGLGGGGCNALNSLIKSQIEGVGFIAANTDLEALGHSLAPVRIQLGPATARGLGAGASPRRGEECAVESSSVLRAALQGAGVVVLLAALGGGTGTGAAPVVARIARDLDILTVAFVTTPFGFEGKRRSAQAAAGLRQLRDAADATLGFADDRLLVKSVEKMTFLESFRLVDAILVKAVGGFIELIRTPALAGVDLAPLSITMSPPPHDGAPEAA